MEDADSQSLGVVSSQDMVPDNTEVLPADTPLWAHRMNKCQVSPL